MALKEYLYLLSDNLIEVRNLRDSVTDALVSAASVSCRVLDTATGDPVAGVADPLSLVAVSGKAGLYRATVVKTAALTAAQEVTIVVTADAGAGLVRVFKIYCVVKETL